MSRAAATAQIYDSETNSLRAPEDKQEKAAATQFAAIVRRAERSIAKRKVKRKPKLKPGTKGYKWSARQRARFVATVARKTKERSREKRAAKAAGLSLAAYRVSGRNRHETEEDRKDAVVASIGRDSEPLARRSKATVGAERSDAIVYLRAATERVAHVSNAELLALLALRRLEGSIK